MRSGLTFCVAAGLMMTGLSGAQATPDAGEPSGGAPVVPGYPTPGQPHASADVQERATTVEKNEGDLRVATLHAEVEADSSAEVLELLQGGMHPRARVLAETVQLNAPDVLVLTGLSYDEHHEIARTLNEEYLSRGQNGQSGVQYPYMFTAPTNSGVDSGADLDGDGQIGGPADALGFGDYAGDQGMAIFSAHPIVEDEVRTFQEFLWQHMPQNSMPTGEFSDLEQSILRLPSTSMWDIPLELPGAEDHVHVVATALTGSPRSEPAEAARKEDQRRMVADYVSGSSWYLYDDAGAYGGLDPNDSFVVAGNLADAVELRTRRPREVPELSSLLDGEAVQDPAPEAVTDSSATGHQTAEEHPQATQGLGPDEAVRSSYVLPAAHLAVDRSGVFWPAEGESGFELVDPSEPASPADRLVWLDIAGS